MRATVFSDNIIVYDHLLSNMLSGIDKDCFIRNDSQQHAIILSKYLLLHAKQKIRIHTATLSQELYSQADVQKYFTQLAKKNNIKIMILIREHQDSEQTSTIEKYKSILMKNVEIRFLKNNNCSLEKYNNFMTIDDDAFRYEITKPNQKADEEIKAVGNFNNLKYTKQFNDIFDFLFEDADIA